MKFKKETPLKVSPLVNYNVPKYPSFYDNLEYAEKSNGLFSLRQTSLIVASALTAMTYLPINAGDGVNKKFKNPFSVSKSGLPYRSSPYGTGAPTRLSDEAAKKFIKQIFKEEGIELKDDFKYNKSGNEFIVTSYNKKMNIGFVYGSYKTLDSIDALLGWSNSYGDYKKMDQKTAIRTIGKAYTKKIDEAFKLNDIKKRSTALEALHKESRKEISKSLLSLEEAKNLEKNAVLTKEFIAVISKYDSRISFYMTNPEKDFEKIFEAKTKEERKKLYKEFQKDFAKKRAATQVMDLEENVRKYIKWAKSHGL